MSFGDTQLLPAWSLTVTVVTQHGQGPEDYAALARVASSSSSPATSTDVSGCRAEEYLEVLGWCTAQNGMASRVGFGPRRGTGPPPQYVTSEQEPAQAYRYVLPTASRSGRKLPGASVWFRFFGGHCIENATDAFLLEAARANNKHGSSAELQQMGSHRGNLLERGRYADC